MHMSGSECPAVLEARSEPGRGELRWMQRDNSVVRATYSILQQISGNMALCKQKRIEGQGLALTGKKVTKEEDTVPNPNSATTRFAL